MIKSSDELFELLFQDSITNFGKRELQETFENLEKENQQLKNQLKQRDKAIDETIDVIDKMLTIGYTDEKNLTSYFGVTKDSEFGCRALILKDILKKYKGDNNEQSYEII